MSALVLVPIALITYVSRAAAVVLLPRPSPRFETILSRIPAAIFASLATATLLGRRRRAGERADPGGGRGRAPAHPRSVAAAVPDRRRGRLRGRRLARLTRAAAHRFAGHAPMTCRRIASSPM